MMEAVQQIVDGTERYEFRKGDMVGNTKVLV